MQFEKEDKGLFGLINLSRINDVGLYMFYNTTWKMTFFYISQLLLHLLEDGIFFFWNDKMTGNKWNLTENVFLKKLNLYLKLIVGHLNIKLSTSLSENLC